MTKSEVITRFCMLAERVLRRKFSYGVSADCFCSMLGRGLDNPEYRFDAKVLLYIEDAVNDKLKSEGLGHEKKTEG
jgi:hypothetical protein